MSHVSKGLFKIKSFVTIAKNMVILQIIVLRESFATTINSDKCLLCNDPLHVFEVPTKNGSRKIQGTRLFNFKQFFYATDEEKRDIFLKMKAKCNTLYMFCTSWLHDSSDCDVKGTC